MSPIKELFARKTPLEEEVDQLLKLPHSVLEKIPGLPPPEGVVSNFEHPHSLRPVFFIVGTTLFSLMLICCGIRVWTKLRIMQPVKFHWNDFTWALALLTSITTYIFLVLSITGSGTVGLHAWDYSLAILFTKYNLVTFTMPPWLIPLAFGLTKLTIWLTYIEIFSAMRWVRTSCYVGATITSLFYFTIVILTLVWVIPPHGQPFAVHIASSGLTHSRSLSVPTACVGLAVDVCLFIIPLLAVSKLQMPRKKKLGVALIFATGALAILASILSIIYREILDHKTDNTWWLVPIYTLTLAELFIGMIIACSWHMSKFIRTYDHKFGKLSWGMGYFLSCRWLRKSKEWKESEKSLKNSQPSATTADTTPMDRPRQEVKKNIKLYPDLDLTNYNKTMDETSSWSPPDYGEDIELATRNAK
ncbi:hypothetical protein NHQ30_006461 [Ciborinia camelliae]|nr:hypothetical protein NHQ30_006461 [Ciborinia camelliae]